MDIKNWLQGLWRRFEAWLVEPMNQDDMSAAERWEARRKGDL